MGKNSRPKAECAQIKSTFFALCKTVNSPHSLALWLCFKYDHDAFVNLEFNPGDYGDPKLEAVFPGHGPEAFRYDLGAHEFLSKFKGLKLSVDPEAAAIQSFKSSEDRMRLVNRSLRHLMGTAEPRLEAIILIARRKISQILGDRTEADFRFGWGPGSTATVKGDVGWDKKILEQRISVTASALPLAQTVVGADLHWCRARGIPAEGPCTLLPGEFKTFPGNTITTVDKNAKTHRTIAIEPTANVYLQKGVGSWIRRRLKKVVRIDLDDQTVNQKFAGRLDYATLDLKAASDSISEALIHLLFPEEWVFLLEQTRSPVYRLDGEWFRYNKWSSMGNGYTFELETLIFYSLAYAAIHFGSNESPHVLAYGDDLLVATPYAECVVSTLEAFGFQLNLKKSHYKDLYRESCGAHFFNRELVTPVYQKEELTNVEEIYHLANRLRHYAARLGGYYYSDSRIRPAWLSAVRLAEKPKFHYLPFVPLTGDPDRKKWSRLDSLSAFLIEDTKEGSRSLDGAFQLSIEDCEHFMVPVLAYGSRHKRYVFKPKKRPYDHGAALAYCFGQGAWLNQPTLSLRGRGASRLKKVRVWQSYRSNIWL